MAKEDYSDEPTDVAIEEDHESLRDDDAINDAEDAFIEGYESELDDDEEEEKSDDEFEI
jgi:hypothetical protein